MIQFDPHALIRRLAEAEWVRKSLPDFVGDKSRQVGTQSMEVPFVVLRVQCNAEILKDDMGRLRHFHTGVGWADGCPGWNPEPDAEKAYWRVLWVLPAKWRIRALQRCENMDAVEAVGSTAEAWLKKQRP